MLAPKVFTVGLAVFLVRTASAQEIADPAETFTFPERASPISTPLITDALRSGLHVHAAPVDASGEFATAISLDVPPGRNGLTPRVTLSYRSGGARRDSPVGAGWTFGAAGGG